ncbi:hypothetical protein E2C01_051888 [Portunus trituberculatus]|uniref:Uncharacterized protein n=1 Tax=Portunus trituberculatus TaxID=210409 RepID=A0A5B7GLN4_PORTR|nr:hypothetical protein [Portunus trituberculatus]
MGLELGHQKCATFTITGDGKRKRWLVDSFRADESRLRALKPGEVRRDPSSCSKHASSTPTSPGKLSRVILLSMLGELPIPRFPGTVVISATATVFQLRISTQAAKDFMGIN